MDIKEVVGLNLQQLREARGLTQAAVAEACEFEPTSYSRWENGKSWPSPSTIKKLAEFYDVPETQFYRDESARKVRPSMDEALRLIEDETGIVLKLPKYITTERARLPDDLAIKVMKYSANDQVWELVRGVIEGYECANSSDQGKSVVGKEHA